MNATTNNSSSMLEKTPARLASISPSNPATLEKLILLMAALIWSVPTPRVPSQARNSSVRWVNWAW